MFVGVERKALVDDLLTVFAEVVSTAEPTMIVLVAPPGWGKTRIVQEFYQQLAARQPAPAHWPPTLVQDPGDAGRSIVELTGVRKTVRPLGPVTGAAAAAPWYWISPVSGRLSDGSFAPALDSVKAQLLMQPAAVDSATPDALEERPQQLAQLLARLVSPAEGRAAVPAIIVLDDAHELDAATADFVAEVLALELPVLILATIWPEKLLTVSGASVAPFPAYLAQTAGSARIVQTWLETLSEEDLIGYVLDQFPATDQLVAARLAKRADHNPYALRLLLNTPRVAASIRAGAIEMDPTEVDDLNGRLEALLAEHWAELPIGVRQVLVAAALMGQSFIDEVLEAGLRRYLPGAGLGEALASSWIRPLGGTGRVIEFVERLRFEIAQGDAADFLSKRERHDIYSGALRAVRLLLPSEPQGIGRVALLALHVQLGVEGVEDDLKACAASAAELADRARSERRRLDALEYYKLAVGWVERYHPVAYDHLVRYLVDFATVMSIQYFRKSSQSASTRALELADLHLPAEHELRIHARCRLARACRRPDDEEDYARCLRLAAEAEDLLGRLTDPSAQVRRDVWAMQVGNRQVEGAYGEAAAVSRELLAFDEEQFGPRHRYTLEEIEDLAYSLHRCGNQAEALELRRELLARRGARVEEFGTLQLAPTKSNLASSLLETGKPENLAEAHQLLTDAITLSSRSFGYDMRSTLNMRSIRTRVWLARGLAAELEGDLGGAQEWFRKAVDEFRRIRQLREEGEAKSQGIAALRLGEALACARDPDALRYYDEALDVFEMKLHLDRSSWMVQECAKSLWWAYRRLRRESEAASVVRRYRLGDAEGDYTPAYMPRR